MFYFAKVRKDLVLKPQYLSNRLKEHVKEQIRTEMEGKVRAQKGDVARSWWLVGATSLGERFTFVSKQIPWDPMVIVYIFVPMLLFSVHREIRVGYIRRGDIRRRYPSWVD